MPASNFFSGISAAVEVLKIEICYHCRNPPPGTSTISMPANFNCGLVPGRSTYWGSFVPGESLEPTCSCSAQVVLFAKYPGTNAVLPQKVVSVPPNWSFSQCSAQASGSILSTRSNSCELYPGTGMPLPLQQQDSITCNQHYQKLVVWNQYYCRHFNTKMAGLSVRGMIGLSLSAML
eukprot:3562314-Rhodomonas_salina.3